MFHRPLIASAITLPLASCSGDLSALDPAGPYAGAIANLWWIMLAGALRAYANRWGVAAGDRVAVFTNNDDGLRTARDLQAKGVDVAAVIDSREGGDLLPGLRHLQGAQVVDSSGGLGLKSVTVRLANGKTETIACTALGVSGGWNPNVSLSSNHRGRPTWDDSNHNFGHGANQALHFKNVQTAEIGDLLEGQRGIVDQPHGSGLCHQGL